MGCRGFAASRVSGAFLTYTEIPANGEHTLIKQSFSSIDSQRTKMHLIAYTSRAQFASLPAAADDPLLQNLVRQRQQRDAGRDSRWAATSLANPSVLGSDKSRPTTANSAASTSSNTSSKQLPPLPPIATSTTTSQLPSTTFSGRRSPLANEITSAPLPTHRPTSVTHKRSFPSYSGSSYPPPTASGSTSQTSPRRSSSVSDREQSTSTATYYNPALPSTRAYPPSLYQSGRPGPSSVASLLDSPQSRPFTTASSASTGLVSSTGVSRRSWAGIGEIDLDEGNSPIAGQGHGYPRSLSTPNPYGTTSPSLAGPATPWQSAAERFPRPTSSHHHPYPRPPSVTPQGSQNDMAASRRLPPILHPGGLPGMNGDSPPLLQGPVGSRVSPLRSSFGTEGGYDDPSRRGSDPHGPEFGDDGRAMLMGVPGAGMVSGWRGSEDERQLRLLGRTL